MTTVLVIEDSQDLRNDIMEMLVIEGYQVHGAANGLVGIEMARALKPNLIICDVMMPELNGYQVLEMLQRDTELAAVPFIFLTSKAEHASMRRGMNLGASDYLTKPFLVVELIDTIRTQLRRQTEQDDRFNRQLNVLRENIITALPHELRTPLNTVLGFSEMFMAEAEKVTPEQIHEWAKHIHIAGQRLLRMTENYLTYARTSVVTQRAEVMQEYREQRLFGVQVLVETQAKRVAERFERLDDLVLDIADVSEVYISYADLLKIVDELLDNAFKFSITGQTVQVNAAPDNGRYCLSIHDHGRGITPEQARNIGAYMQFDRWFYEQQGMGLGLAIVDRLVTLYGATLNITPLPDKGTLARVFFGMSE